MVRAAVVGLAVAAAVVPLPATWVEWAYARAFYPIWQTMATTASNAVPIALLDFLIVGLGLSWLLLAVVDVRRSGARGRGRAVGRIAARTAVWAAAGYLVFLVSWGLNYRRVRLEDALGVDRGRVSAGAARALAIASTGRLNGLYETAHLTQPSDGWSRHPALASAFGAALNDLGARPSVVVARPKHTLLNPYFRRASVDGMTDPFFLETLVVSDLLPVEQSFVTAHEWAHLAGFAHEGEANFLGWLTCMHGDAWHQYSGWLFLYTEVSATLGGRDRTEIAARLAPGPRGDLRAIAERVQRNRSPRVSAVGWSVYNQYLKANRVEAGVASYTEVVRLILGTRFSPITRSP